MKKSLLVIDDDEVFCATLQRVLEKRDFEVALAHHATSALVTASAFDPEYILLDLRIHADSGLALIPELLALNDCSRIVVLTGYANVATAVEAIKLGALYYLAKPAGIDEIIAAFDKNAGNPLQPIENIVALDKIEQDYILKVLELNHGNISATARELKLHRRSLQRKLDRILR